MASEQRRKTQNELEGQRRCPVLDRLEQSAVLQIDRLAELAQGQSGELAYVAQIEAGLTHHLELLGLRKAELPGHRQQSARHAQWRLAGAGGEPQHAAGQVPVRSANSWTSGASS